MEDRLQLVLASGSPRRRAILERLGLPCRVVVPYVEETRLEGERPEGFVGRVAAEKAGAVSRRILAEEGARPWVLGADTEVVVDGAPLGKPGDATEAAAMLARLSGRDHVVLTGLCVTRAGGPEALHVEETRVWFRQLEADEIARYVESGEPFDKAGGYGIQGLGCFLVSRIEGNYENVVGLPASPLVELLRGLGLLAGFPFGDDGHGRQAWSEEAEG